MERRTTAAGGVGGVIVVAWLATSIFYFYQYVMRSAPAVMMPQLSEAFALSTAGLAALVGLFYYGYAPFSLVAGVAMDQLGARRVVPLGCATMAVGSVLFALGDPNLAAVGRLLQGMGGVFALIGAAYIATTNFPASRAATLIGVTQMFGMAGGSAGQFLVGPAIAGGMTWNGFWIIMSVIGAVIALALFLVMPKSTKAAQPNWFGSAMGSLGTVFANPQSILCGLIAGLFFIPTTIFDMTWGVRFLQESHDMPYGMAVLRSASVPFGWIIGCPLVGMLSDRIGRRKPVIIGCGLLLMGCLALVLYGPADLFPPFALGLATGIVSGAAMIPYTVIKEANRSEHAGAATGVVNFINFSFSALLGPVFGNLLLRASDGGPRQLEHYQQAFSPLLYGVGLAVLLTLILKETGTAARSAASQPVSADPA